CALPIFYPGLVAAAGNQDADADGRFLAGVDHLLARSIGLVPHLDALYGVLARSEPGSVDRLAFFEHADGLAIDEHLDAIHVGIEDEGTELGRGGGGWPGSGRNIGQQHFGIVVGLVGGGVLPVFGVLAHLGVDVLGEFIGGDHAIAGSIGLACHALDDVVGEDAVAAFEIGAFEGALAGAAGGEGEEALAEIAEGVIDVLGILGSDGAGVAGVGEEDFGFGLDLATDHVAEFVHGIAGIGDAVAVDIKGREVALALVHETVAGEVDEDAVILLGDAGEPGIDLAAESGEGGLIVGEQVHVFDAEVAAFGADERGEDGLGVAFGEVELVLVRQVAVARDADDDGVTDRDPDGLGGARGDGIELLDFEIALLVWRGRLGEGKGGGESKEEEEVLGGTGGETWEKCPHEWGHGSLKGYATVLRRRASELGGWV